MDNLSLFIKPEMIRETEIILKLRNDNDKGESNKYLDVIANDDCGATEIF